MAIQNKPSLSIYSIFALVLIYLKQDNDLRYKTLTNDQIVSYIFLKDYSSSKHSSAFEVSLDDVFPIYQNSAFLNEVAMPLFIKVLKEPMLLNTLFSLLFLFSKDLATPLPGKKPINIDKTHPETGNTISFNIHMNSIIGKFLMSAYVLYSENAIAQEEHNLLYLKEINTNYFVDIEKQIDALKLKSHLVNMLLNGDYTPLFKQYKKGFLKEVAKAPVYLQKLTSRKEVQKPINLNQLRNVLSEKENYSFCNYTIQDYFFNKLDSCSSQYELLNMFITLVCDDKYANESKFVTEAISTIIEKSRDEEDKDFRALMSALLYIKLSFGPKLQNHVAISRSSSDDANSIDKLIFEISQQEHIMAQFIEILSKFALANNCIYSGSFEEGYTTFREAFESYLRGKKTADRTPSRVKENHKLYMKMYQSTLEYYYSSIGYFDPSFIGENESLFVKINKDYGPELSPLDQRKLVLEKKKEELYETEDFVNFKEYVEIEKLVEQKTFRQALVKIDNILHSINPDNYIWKFEFKLLKCLTFEKCCNNAVKVKKLFQVCFPNS